MVTHIGMAGFAGPAFAAADGRGDGDTVSCLITMLPGKLAGMDNIPGTLMAQDTRHVNFVISL